MKRETAKRSAALALGCAALALGCAGAPARRSRSVAPEAQSAAAVTATPSADSAVPRVPCAHIAAPAPRVSGTAWQVPFEMGFGPLSLDVTDGFLVAWLKRGTSVSVDFESGSTCAELAKVAAASSLSSAIDPEAAHTAVLHSALVGPKRFGLAAVELGSGAVRWKRDPLTPGNTDDSALNELELAATKTAMIVGFQTRVSEGHSSHYDQLVAALDPRTGADLWRKTIASTPPGESFAREDFVQLSSDGERVFVRGNGKLVALDATGTEIWSTTWSPHPRTYGSLTPALRAPVVAAGGDRVALAFPDRIELFDARTGAKSGSFAVPGEMATDLMLHEGVVIAALERKAGTARVLAIDAGSARGLWTEPVRYAVFRLRVSAGAAYVLDGNGRIWARDLRSGALRFGFGTSSFDFAVAPTSSGTPRIVVPQDGLTAFEPALGSVPPPLEPFALWELEPKPDPNGEQCHPRALSWLDGEDRVLWRSELPNRLRALPFGRCAETEVSDYRRWPRHNAHLLYEVLGTLELDSVLVEADSSGLLALRKTDGQVMLDFDASRHGVRLSFDQGRFELLGVPGCKGESRNAQIFARCDNRIVYFNGETAALIRLNPLGIEARAEFKSGTSKMDFSLRSRTSIPLGRFTLRLDGVLLD